MDVHPTKNVSIGIDPYPSVPLKMCFFPWSMDSTAFGRWRPQQRSKWPSIARSKPAIRKVEHHNVRCSAFFLFSCIYLCTHIYMIIYVSMYINMYIYIHIHTQNGILLYCYTHHTSSHNSVMSTAMTIHPILNQLGYESGYIRQYWWPEKIAC